MMTKQTINRIAAAAASIVLVTGAKAAEWGTDHVTFHVDKGNFPPGSKQTYLTDVQRLFNNNPSNFWITLSYDLSNGTGRVNNGRNEIFMSSKESAPAACYNQYDWLGLGDEIIESDIRISTKVNVPWSYSYNKVNLLSFNPFNGTGRPLEATLLHELGHAAGLGHEADVYNIMGTDWNHVHCNGATVRAYMGEDACNALVYAYGRYSAGSIEDVSVSPFKRVGRAGEYSAHDFCTITDTAGNLLRSNAPLYDPATGLYNPDWDFGQMMWRYKVSKGQTIISEFTFENNGETNKTPNIGIYLSTDNNVTTADTFLGSFSYTLTRNDDGVATLRIQFNVPTNLQSGQNYFVGAIVDFDRLITEIDEQNAAYHMIRIK